MNEAEEIKKQIREADAANLPLWRGQHQLACWHVKQGNLDAARKTLEIAISGTDDPNGQATCAMTLARLLCQEGKSECARSLMADFNTSLITDELVLAKFQHNYGNVLAVLEDHEAAQEQYEFSISYFEMAGEPKRADVRNNLARALIHLGKAEQAHPHLDISEAYYRLDSDEAALAQTLEVRALAYLAQNLTDDALTTINESLSYLTDEALLLVESLRTKGRILARMKRVAECAAAYGQAVELLKRILQDTSQLEFEMNSELLPIVEWNRKRLALELSDGKKKRVAEMLGVKPETVRLWIKADPSLAGSHEPSTIRLGMDQTPTV